MCMVGASACLTTCRKVNDNAAVLPQKATTMSYETDEQRRKRRAREQSQADTLSQIATDVFPGMSLVSDYTPATPAYDPPSSSFDSGFSGGDSGGGGSSSDF